MRPPVPFSLKRMFNKISGKPKVPRQFHSEAKYRSNRNSLLTLTSGIPLSIRGPGSLPWNVESSFLLIILFPDLVAPLFGKGSAMEKDVKKARNKGCSFGPADVMISMNSRLGSID